MFQIQSSSDEEENSAVDVDEATGILEGERLRDRFALLSDGEDSDGGIIEELAQTMMPEGSKVITNEHVRQQFTSKLDDDDIEEEPKHSCNLGTTKSIKRLSCPTCQRVFANAATLASHIETEVCVRDVKLIGKKAREKREAINSQRPVICRVDQSVISSRKSPSISIPVSTNLKKRKRKPKINRPYQSVELASEAQNIDNWLPDLTPLPICSKQTRSSLVQLHGLPINTTPENIFTFFSGLDISQIWILPPLSQHVREWDANYTRSASKTVIIGRCLPSVRVLVRFSDAIAAEIAACRSGELMYVPCPAMTGADETVVKPSEFGVSVAVTQWTKTFASYINRYKLYIDAQAKVPITKSLEDVSRSLQPIVPSILWTSMARDLKLSIKSNLDEDAPGQYAPMKKSSTEGISILLEGSAYETYEEAHNQMLKDYNDLLLTQQCLDDPGLLATESTYRLRAKALDYLRAELSASDLRLSLARRWNMLESTKALQLKTKAPQDKSFHRL